MGPVGRARQAGVREHQGAGRASSTPALSRPPRNPEWAKLQSATWAPQLQPERWSCPDLCDLERSSALVSPSTPFRWGAFERPRKKSFICMLFSATFYRPACQLFWVLALYPLSSRPLLCPPWASPGGAGPLDMPPPRPPPRLAYVPHVTLLLLLFPSPLPSRPECGLLWHDFPSRSLLWLSPVRPFSWTQEALANREVPQNHGAVSTVRAKLGTSLGGGPAWFGERAGRCHAEETACAVPGSGPT